jgi:hypothetical protein
MTKYLAAALLVFGTSLFAQDAPAPSPWSFTERIEIRANYRNSHQEKFQLKFPFPASFLPIGQKFGFEETADAGSHLELSVLQLKLDAKYGKWFAARAQIHGEDKYRRNPTTSDRQVDADELWIRIGEKPEFLERPERTSFFLQVGKAPKMERQPIRLLESYGLAATSFNRMEDTQVLTGGSVGRNLYWRLQLANGNPLFFRDPNALAGDNGQPELNPFVHPNPDPSVKSGFPILYNAETEDLFFNTNHVQWGEALGYRWQRDDQSAGFDAIVFHYQRELADREELTGTAYGGDLDLLVLDEIPGIAPRGLPIDGRDKIETGARVYAEWHSATLIAQYTQQSIAGNDRRGWEVEAGYHIPLAFGPIESIQPAVRASALRNDFGPVAGFPAPSIWWNWDKVDGGVRVGLKRGIDVTVEYTQHHVESRFPLKLREALLTVRWRA